MSNYFHRDVSFEKNPENSKEVSEKRLDPSKNLKEILGDKLDENKIEQTQSNFLDPTKKYDFKDADNSESDFNQTQEQSTKASEDLSNDENLSEQDKSEAENNLEKKSSYSDNIDGKIYYYDDNGKVYRIDNDLIPNSNYEINGYKYKTDKLGRIISAEGKLKTKEHEGRKEIKDSIEIIGKGDQKEGDDRGHLIGDQFDGSNGMENLIPQNADINRRDYKKLENELAKEVKAEKDVRVNVEVVYDTDSRRPSAIVVTYSVDGKLEMRIFPNDKD